MPSISTIALISQNGYAQQCARRSIRRQTAGNNVPNCDEVASITNDKDGGLDKVLKAGTESS
jgi:hypothetical protein